MADEKFAPYVANNYVNDKGGIEESLIAGGDTGVGQINHVQQAGEDPLFMDIAGNSKEFVYGVPKETWDQMSPEERSKISTMPKITQKIVRGVGAGAMAIPFGVGGTLAGTAAGAKAGLFFGGPGGAVKGAAIGGIVGGTAGGGFGASLGYDMAQDYIDDFNAKPPISKTREELNQEFESAKGRE